MGADVQHHRRTLLAVAVCIIGSHRNEYFQLAFKFTTEWGMYDESMDSVANA